MCFKTRAYETQRPGRSCAQRPEGAVWPRRAVRRAVNVDDRSVRSTSDRIRARRAMASRFPARQRTDAGPVGAGRVEGVSGPRLSRACRVRELGHSGRDRRFARRAAGVAAVFGIDPSPPTGPPRRGRSEPRLRFAYPTGLSSARGVQCRHHPNECCTARRLRRWRPRQLHRPAGARGLGRAPSTCRGSSSILTRAAGITDHLTPCGMPATGASSCSAACAGSSSPPAPTSPRWSTRLGNRRHLPGRRTQAAGLAACPVGLARCGSSVSGPGLPAGG